MFTKHPLCGGHCAWDSIEWDREVLALGDMLDTEVGF